MVHGGGHHGSRSGGGGGGRRGGGWGGGGGGGGGGRRGGGGGGGSGFSFGGGGGGGGGHRHHGRGGHPRWARRPQRERIVVIDHQPARGPRFWPRWVFQPTVRTRMDYHPAASAEPLVPPPRPPPPPAQVPRATHGQSAGEPTNRRGGGCCRFCCCCCRGPFIVRAVVPLFVLFVLMGISGQHSHEKWTMNPGESRQVLVPGGSTLTKSVSIRRLDSKGKGGGGGGDDAVAIFRTAGGCPPLTGPTITLRETHQMTLSPGDYEYDYYHLNPGSRIDATLTPSRGGAALLLVRGKAAFDRWAEDPNEGQHAVLLKSYSSSRFRPATIGYKADAAETYYVAYDNAMSRTAKVTADVNVALTSYDVSRMRPIPSSACSSDRSACEIDLDFAKSAGCTVVRAEVPDGSLAATGRARNEQHVVTVEIRTRRRWSAILSLCAVPLLLALWLCRRTRGGAGDGDDDRGGPYEEVDGEMPPPTVPGSDAPSARPAEPSAPLATDDEGVVDGAVLGEGDAEYQASIPVAVPVPNHSPQ